MNPFFRAVHPPGVGDIIGAYHRRRSVNSMGSCQLRNYFPSPAYIVTDYISPSRPGADIIKSAGVNLCSKAPVQFEINFKADKRLIRD